MGEREDFSQSSPQNQPTNGPPFVKALGLDAIHNLCKEIYPQQVNPLTVTAIVKYWLGGPDPLDYISMYENPGCPELGIPPHWHYVSLGLSDLHGDGRIHPVPGPGQLSGYGFELTFRLIRERGETTPPTWPANVMQQLAKYVFNSANMILPGDHVSWHSALDGGNGRITQILMANDPQLPILAPTPHGDVAFIQVIGVTSEELEVAQHWNGIGMVNVLKSTGGCGPWLITDMKRTHSIMDVNPSAAERIRTGIEKQGSNLSGVSARCWWVQISGNDSIAYRQRREDSDNEEDMDSVVKLERLTPPENANAVEENGERVLPGLHITFNLEAGKLLPLVLKGRVLHGHHFTFKSILSNTAITLVPPAVTGTFVSNEKPYVLQGPWLQVLIREDLAQKMARDLQVLSVPSELQLPKTFSWPEVNLLITVVND